MESRDANNCGCVRVFTRTKRNLQTSSNIAISEILNDARTLKPLNNNTRKSRFAVRIYSASHVSHEIALFLIYLIKKFSKFDKADVQFSNARFVDGFHPRIYYFVDKFFTTLLYLKWHFNKICFQKRWNYQTNFYTFMLLPFFYLKCLKFNNLRC